MSNRPESSDDQAREVSTHDGMSRRNILLAGTIMAATSARGATAQAQPAPPSRPAAPSGRKPNILVIFGDDIGLWNVSAYNRGMMGYRTPNIDRIAKEGAIFTDHYAQQSCTAGRAAFITGQSCFRTGLLKVGLPGAKEGLSEKDPTLGGVAQAAGLRDRAVRQEPSRRPQRVPADGARLRRVLRQPLPPQRGGRAGESRLPEGPSVPGQVRAARRPALQGERPRRSHGGPALRPRRQADNRRHRPAHAQAYGDGGRGVPERLAWTSSIGNTRPTRRSSAGSTRPACTSTRTSRPRRRARQAWASLQTA